ncbi:MAG: rod shape-determining protein MreD [Firmicutes bacterium]|nr:rod shape-determining protein MreD [Bacillota bacterium]
MKKEVRLLLLFLAFFLSLIFQTTIIPFFQLRGVVPDLLLVLIVFTALFYGAGAGGAAGFAVGFARDLLVGRCYGLQALSGFVAGYAVGCLEGKVFKENPLVSLFLVFSGSLLSGLIFLVGRGITGHSFFSLSLVWRDLILGGLYNTLLAVFLFRPFTRLAAPPAPPGVDPVRLFLDYRG